MINFSILVLTLLTTSNKQNSRVLPGLKINYRSVCAYAHVSNTTARTGGTDIMFGTPASIFCYVMLFLTKVTAD